MKKFIFAILLTIGFCSFGFGETAKEIMDKAKNKADIKSVGTRSKMEIQQGGKTLNVLVIDQYSSKDKNGLQRTMVIFKSPANAKGTRFLMLARKDGSTDQQIFLPNLGKSRRISAEAEGDDAFMGTDFSYNDVSFLDRDTSLDTFSIIKEEKYAGKDCFVIQSIPKDKNYIYAKTILWVAKENYLFLKGEFYDRKNNLAKIIECSDYKNAGGIMTPYTTKLSTVKTNTSTLVTIQRIEYGMKIPDRVFTKRYLETGK